MTSVDLRIEPGTSGCDAATTYHSAIISYKPYHTVRGSEVYIYIYIYIHIYIYMIDCLFEQQFPT